MKIDPKIKKIRMKNIKKIRTNIKGKNLQENCDRTELQLRKSQRTVRNRGEEKGRRGEVENS